MSSKIKPVSRMGVKLYPQVGNQCWRYALAHLLQVKPARVPDFSKNNDPDFVIKTRKWLNKYNKTILYVPSDEFYEKNEKIKYNPPEFPEGDCLACAEAIVDGKVEYHACLLRDGYQLEHPDSEIEITNVLGYFVIYDLCQKLPKLK